MAGEKVEALGTREMDPFAREVARKAKGFMAEDEGLRLYELAREGARLGPVLEVGSYCGKSSIFLGCGVREVGGRLVCLDHHRGSEENQQGQPWHDEELWDEKVHAMDSVGELRRNLRIAGLEDNTVLLVTTTEVAAPLWTAPLGMLFIDGGHTFRAAHGDYEAWSDRLLPGGILAIHDLFPDPDEGGQAPIEVYRRAVASGDFEELEPTLTLGALRRKI